MLCAVLGSQPMATTLLEDISTDMEWALEPDPILDVRPGAHKQQPQVLIKWVELPEFEATWDDFNVIKQQYSTFHLGDKVRLPTLGRGIDSLLLLMCTLGKGKVRPAQ